ALLAPARAQAEQLGALKDCLPALSELRDAMDTLERLAAEHPADRFCKLQLDREALQKEQRASEEECRALTEPYAQTRRAALAAEASMQKVAEAEQRVAARRDQALRSAPADLKSEVSEANAAAAVARILVRNADVPARAAAATIRAQELAQSRGRLLAAEQEL